MATTGTPASAIPEGFIGNLSSAHEAVLKQFWERFYNLENDKDFKVEANPNEPGTKIDAAAIRKTFWDASVRENPDSIMLRFCRARSWNIDRAFAMGMEAMKWRVRFGVEKIISEGEPVYNDGMTGFEFVMKSGKAYLHGADPKERPLFYIHVKLHRPSDQPAASLEKFTIYSIETGRLFIQPPLGQCTLVFDLTGFGLKNMDWNFIMFLVKSFEAYYPESLGLVLVHNAPWVFWGVWKVLSPLLDPVVRSKIAFTQSAKELLEYIPANRLPKDMGGEEDYKWSYTRPSDKATQKSNDVEGKKAHVEALQQVRAKYEEKTKEWIKSGSSESVKKERDALALDLKIAGIEADPYLHPLSIYHEYENLTDDNTIVWKYKSDAGTQTIGVSLKELKAQQAALKEAK